MNAHTRLRTTTASRWLIAFGALLIFGALNFAIVGKERIKHSGEVVYLALEPVDPRSLMQGDYMALRFALVRQLEAPAGAESVRREGELARAPIALDERRVAQLADHTTVSAPLTLRYRIRQGRVWLGTNAFFFQEGDAERFNGARFGEFRVDRDSGEAVLVGLRGAQLEPL